MCTEIFIVFEILDVNTFTMLCILTYIHILHVLQRVFLCVFVVVLVVVYGGIGTKVFHHHDVHHHLEGTDASNQTVVYHHHLRNINDDNTKVTNFKPPTYIFHLKIHNVQVQHFKGFFQGMPFKII